MPRTVNRRPLACVVQSGATGRLGGHTRREARRGRRAGLRRGRPAQSAAGRDGDFVDLRRGATRALRTPYAPAGSRCTTCAPSASTGSSTIRSKAPSADALALARPVCGLRRENERRRRRRCPAGGCFREDSGRTNRRQRTLSPGGQALYTTLWDSNRDPLSAAVTAAHPAHPRDATRTPVRSGFACSATARSTDRGSSATADANAGCASVRAHDPVLRPFPGIGWWSHYCPSTWNR